MPAFGMCLGELQKELALIAVHEVKSGQQLIVLLLLHAGLQSLRQQLLYVVLAPFALAVGKTKALYVIPV
jgi:hypothetical protein